MLAALFVLLLLLIALGAFCVRLMEANATLREELDAYHARPWLRAKRKS